jgi:hypothetical protein
VVAGHGSCIGVPRFELGTSPTRTERATRLRHTPNSWNRLAKPVYHRGAGVLHVIEPGGLGDRARLDRR